MKKLLKNKRCLWLTPACKKMFLMFIASLFSLSPTFALDIEKDLDNDDWNDRSGSVSRIILHSTGGQDCKTSISFKGGSLESNVRHFKQKKSLSVHYIVGKDGKIVQMVAENKVAYHAKGSNSKSIGIELVNDGNTGKLEPLQFDQTVLLLKEIISRHGLTKSAIYSHNKVDKRYSKCKSGKELEAREGEAGAWKKKVDPDKDEKIVTELKAVL